MVICILTAAFIRGLSQIQMLVWETGQAGLTLVDAGARSYLSFICHKTYIKMNNLEKTQLASPGLERERAGRPEAGAALRAQEAQRRAGVRRGMGRALARPEGSAAVAATGRRRRGTEVHLQRPIPEAEAA